MNGDSIQNAIEALAPLFECTVMVSIAMAAYADLFHPQTLNCSWDHQTNRWNLTM